ncbi:MAG: DUF2254 domain-containing protein [Syntrophales bacterium]|jgi:uncharacterized membrane protein|nr:DUF2254 domain-containing protein [Syntrophales bacterium]
MKTRLSNLWESIRTSFWFLPALMVVLGIILSFFFVEIDRRVKIDAYRVFGFTYAVGPEGIRSVLSVIAGSMITVAGVVFSITVVALTLASNQFGPRLLRNFMLDKGNQVVLGTFISTYIYCLLVLQSVRTEDRVFMPSLSVTFAVVLALINVGILIYFIHHISTSIQADRVIALVYYDLEMHLRRFFPEEFNPESPGREQSEPELHLKTARCRECRVAAPKAGYLQAIDRDTLLESARKKDLVLNIPWRPGEFIVEGSTIVKVENCEKRDEGLEKRLAEAFILGEQRTPVQDPEFAIHQLVEVALRALSPGINDPFTAIACIDRLCSALCYLSGRKFPSPYLYDDKGILRIRAKTVTFSGMTSAAFDQIRQYGRPTVAVTIRLLEAMATLAAHSRNSEQRRAILRQTEMIEKASHRVHLEEYDRKDVLQRYRTVLDLVHDPNSGK